MTCRALFAASFLLAIPSQSSAMPHAGHYVVRILKYELTDSEIRTVPEGTLLFSVDKKLQVSSSVGPDYFITTDDFVVRYPAQQPGAYLYVIIRRSDNRVIGPVEQPQFAERLPDNESRDWQHISNEGESYRSFLTWAAWILGTVITLGVVGVVTLITCLVKKRNRRQRREA